MSRDDSGIFHMDRMVHIDLVTAQTWTVRFMFSGRKLLYGPYGPYILEEVHLWTVWAIYFGRKSIYGPYGPYILEESPYMDRTVHICLLESPQGPHIPSRMSIYRLHDRYISGGKSIYMDGTVYLFLVVTIII